MAWGDITNPDAWKQAMANLLRRGGEVTDYIEQAPVKAGQAIIDAGQRQQALMDKAFDPTGKKLIRDTQAANQAATNLFEGPLSFAPVNMIAWHGSPHSFDKFDISKVGTGEGAQAYGYGGYFAEAPQTAKQYQATLSNPKYKVGEKELKGNDAWAAQFLHSFEDDALPKRIDVDTAVKKAQEILKPGETQTEIVNKIKDLDKAGLSVENGYLYKVDIPDEYIPKMLDFDKPLAQQPKNVLDSLKKLNDPYINEAITTQPKLSKDGEYWTYMGNTYATKSEALADATPHRIISGYTGIGKDPKDVSKALQDVDIKGVKYLDQGSRTDKSGTSNFVVFDPSNVKMLERNNQPLTRKEVIEEQLNKLKD